MPSSGPSMASLYMQKHKSRRKKFYVSRQSDTFLGVISKSGLKRFAGNCFGNVVEVCKRLSLVPLEESGDGKFVVGSLPRQFNYCGLLAIGFLCCVYKLWACVHIMGTEEIGVRTFICITSFLISFIPWSASISLMFVLQGTCDLMNSWASVQHCIYRCANHRGGLEYPTKNKFPIEDGITALNIACLALLPVWMGLGGPVLLLMSENLPVSYLFLFQTLGWVPSSESSSDNKLQFGQVLSYIVESGTAFLMWFPPVFMYSVLSIGTDVGQSFGSNVG